MAEFNWDEEVAKNMQKMVDAQNQSGEKSSKGLTEVARLITDADQRQATEDAKKKNVKLNRKQGKKNNNKL